MSIWEVGGMWVGGMAAFQQFLKVSFNLLDGVDARSRYGRRSQSPKLG